MAVLAWVGCTFIAGIIGTVFIRDWAVRAEWALASVICFLGTSWKATPSVVTKEPAPVVTRTINDEIMDRVAIKQLARRANDLSRIADSQVRLQPEDRSSHSVSFGTGRDAVSGN